MYSIYPTLKHLGILVYYYCMNIDNRLEKENILVYIFIHLELRDISITKNKLNTIIFLFEYFDVSKMKLEPFRETGLFQYYMYMDNSIISNELDAIIDDLIEKDIIGFDNNELYLNRNMVCKTEHSAKLNEVIDLYEAYNSTDVCLIDELLQINDSENLVGTPLGAVILHERTPKLTTTNIVMHNI